MVIVREKEIRSLEEKYTEAYWFWRAAMESPGYDLRREIQKFLFALRDYQQALRDQGHVFE